MQFPVHTFVSLFLFSQEASVWYFDLEFEYLIIASDAVYWSEQNKLAL